MAKKIVIIGGVAGGASAAARLRRLDEYADIVMLERGVHISFANCGLPYYIGGEIQSKSALTLSTPDSFHTRFRIDVRTGHEALLIDRKEKVVTVRKLKTGDIYKEAYDSLILSMGAEPVRLFDGESLSDRVFTLRNIPDAVAIKSFLEERKPESAVVVGGGFIGMEMAENLHRAGLRVTVVETQNQILPPLDYDMVCDVHRHVRSKGVSLLLGTSVDAVREEEDGLLLHTSRGELTADLMILSVGVRPESQIAADAGLTTGSRNGIIVDSQMRTSDPDIYAVGDVVEVLDFVGRVPAMIPLAGPANKQGRIAADNAAGLESSYKGTQGSSIARVLGMTVAATGLSEKSAVRLGLPYEKSFTYSSSHATYYPGAEFMSVKLLFDPESGKVLGGQLVGFQGVDKRCDVLATVIRFGGTVHDLTELELCYAPPYSSAKDPVNMAGYVAENIRSGAVKVFHWHDVEDILRDTAAVLLDVRTESEYRRGAIEGSVNIPLDSLRERINELDKEVPYYVACQVGMRGYIACRILTQRGFDCWNLSGGYRLYHAATSP